MTLAEVENLGAQFSKTIGKPTLAALRAMPAQDLLEASIKTRAATNAAIVDGWFLPQDTIYPQAKQNDIALITGGTNDEVWDIGPYPGGGCAAPPKSLAAYTAWVRQTFGARADAFDRIYPAKTGAEADKAYHDVCRDMNFAVHRTWARVQATTGKSPVYLYKFSHNPPHPDRTASIQRPRWGRCTPRTFVTSSTPCA